MLPLTTVNAGDTVKIVKIHGKDETRQHLAAMGFVENGPVTVVSRIAGNLILQVKNTRIALDRSMANRIMVGRKEQGAE